MQAQTDRSRLPCPQAGKANSYSAVHLNCDSLHILGLPGAFILLTAMYVVKEQHGRYETVDTLADGAMGTVLLARDRLLDRLVAVKIVKLQGVTDPEERQRLQEALASEAQVVQLLAHPNIVSVHDVVTDDTDQAPSLVMEYVQGSTLESFLKGGKPLPLDFALSVANQVAQGLEHAHTMGVIHGDIKPSNILISDDNEQAKIVDFSIARLMSDEGVRDERLFGTPRYVSPEQLLGQKADQRSDLFSLGVVLYEMLTGKSPFRGQTPEEITQEIASGSADLRGSALKDVPEPLWPVLRRALERDPSDRFQSARQMARMLQDPDRVDLSSDTVATQDLSALVIPEIPDIDPALAEPESADSPTPKETEAPNEPGHYSAAHEPLPIARLAWIGGLTAAAALLLGFLLIWLLSPSGPVDARFDDEHQLRTQLLPLLKEGHRLLKAREPEVAARVLERALVLAPGNTEIARLRTHADQEARDLQVYQQKSAEMNALLEQSRRALNQGSSQRALRLATQALSVDPENPEARALADAARSYRSRRPATSSPPPIPVIAPKPKPVETRAQTARSRIRESDPEPVVPAQPAPLPLTENRPVSTTADLRVDVFSYLSKGVLTVYADEEQVLLQPFRFVQKSGFLRKKKTAGRLETSVQLPSGPKEFRIYVSADGQETQTVNLNANLAGGQTHVLRLVIAENGSASAQLN